MIDRGIRKHPNNIYMYKHTYIHTHLHPLKPSWAIECVNQFEFLRVFDCMNSPLAGELTLALSNRLVLTSHVRNYRC